jgi:hypothetical protein
MPPSPYKRDRRTKSRLMGASDTDRANLRAKAVELMRGSRGRGMTPADGSPDQDKQRLNRVRAAANRERQVTTDGGAPKDVTGRLILRRQDGGGVRMSNPPKASPKPPNPSPMGSAPAPGGIGRFRNRTNNPRRGLIGRRIPRPGGEIHDYPGTKNDVFVRKTKPESGGTGNQSAPQTALRNDELPKGTRPVERRPASAYDKQLGSLARQRALSMNRSKRGRRKLFRAA